MEETLLDYLRRKNPDIVYLNGHISNPFTHAKPPPGQVPLAQGPSLAGRVFKKKIPKSTSICRSWDKPKHIYPWRGLDEETIKKMYAQILTRRDKRPAINLKPIDIFVRKEENVSDIVLRWNREVFSQALEETMKGTDEKRMIYMIRGSLGENFGGNKKPWQPDWGTWFHIPEEQGETDPRERDDKSIMPGDTKSSWSWSSEDIKVGSCAFDEDQTPSWYWPIAQIFTYCLGLKTRYGYIITDKELVLCRIGPNRDSAPEGIHPYPIRRAVKEDGKLEYFSIPWENGRGKDEEDRGDGKAGEDAESAKGGERGGEIGKKTGMSMNTALWWIHMQAASRRSILWKYPPLDQDAFEPNREPSPSPRLQDDPPTTANKTNKNHNENNSSFPRNPQDLKDGNVSTGRRNLKRKYCADNWDSNPSTGRGKRNKQ